MMFFSIPIELYSNKINNLLYPLTNEIISNNLTDTNYEHIYSFLNQLDNVMCNKNLDLDKNEKEQFSLDLFFFFNTFNLKICIKSTRRSFIVNKINISLC